MPMNKKKLQSEQTKKKLADAARMLFFPQKDIKEPQSKILLRLQAPAKEIFITIFKARKDSSNICWRNGTGNGLNSGLRRSTSYDIEGEDVRSC